MFWNGHDTGFGDDDYNIKIQTRDVPDTVYLSGVTRGNSGADGNPIRMIKGEFDSDETVDQDAFDNIPWWKAFHDAVDEGDGLFDDGGAAARAKINNHFAIMSGFPRRRSCTPSTRSPSASTRMSARGMMHGPSSSGTGATKVSVVPTSTM